MYEFPLKVFYWALSSDFQFKSVPSLNTQYNDKINADTSFFTGEPNRKLFSDKPAEGAEEAEAEPKAEDEEGEDGKKVAAAAQNSDETEEEEIKVPVRDLIGKACVSDLCRIGQTHDSYLRD
jgi:hypothetical protein